MAKESTAVLSKKRTKIVATIGPVSESEEILTAMIKNGMNVARLNFSHNELAWHKKIIRRLRLVSRKLKTPIGIMADLQGPRIRIANRVEVPLKEKETVWVTERPGKGVNMEFNPKHKLIYIELKDLVSMVNVGTDILVEDGLIRMRVVSKSKTRLKCTVLDGGTVKHHKGVNIPGISGKLGALTKRDLEVLDFALGEDVDFVAMSFVRNAAEINKLKAIIRRKTGREEMNAQVIAKIERREAVEDFDEILKATDGVMVARGDLGVEMPQAALPIIQKEIIAKCLKFGKPVIVATQMMDSMIHNPRPTRAEISDVSNAVIDHADAVMLSGETAGGRYPVEAVKTMREIIERTERSPFDDLKSGFLEDKKSSISAAIAQSAHELMKDSHSVAVVVASVSGYTARIIARHRPEQRIVVVSNNQKTQNQLTLVWGAEGFVLPECKTLDELISRSVEMIVKKKMFKKGERIVIVAGRPHLKKEHMSLVKIEEIR
jgi:pyruvate kinase